MDSWVTLIFGAGVQYEGDLVALLDANGQSVAFEQANTRWGAGHTRLIRLLPESDLTAGAWYTARLRGGVELVDGQVSADTWELDFQVPCDTADDPACPDLGDIPIAHIDGIPQPSPEPVVQEESGCACASTPGGSWGLGLALAVLAGARRFRQSVPPTSE